jgi:hypothetical protein
MIVTGEGNTIAVHLNVYLSVVSPGVYFRLFELFHRNGSCLGLPPQRTRSAPARTLLLAHAMMLASVEDGLNLVQDPHTRSPSLQIRYGHVAANPRVIKLTRMGNEGTRSITRRM